MLAGRNADRSLGSRLLALCILLALATGWASASSFKLGQQLVKLCELELGTHLGATLDYRGDQLGRLELRCLAEARLGLAQEMPKGFQIDAGGARAIRMGKATAESPVPSVKGWSHFSATPASSTREKSPK